MELATVALSVVASLMTVIGGVIVARRMQRLGVGAAEERLTATLKALKESYEARIEDLERKVTELTTENRKLRAQVAELRLKRNDSLQDIDDLRAEIRGLRERKSE